MRFSTFVVVFSAITLPVCVAHAQDTTRRGVTIGLTYDPTSRPGIAVLPACPHDGSAYTLTLNNGQVTITCGSAHSGANAMTLL